MSVHVRWRPVPVVGASIGGSVLAQKLGRVFGEPPWYLKEEDRDLVAAMAAADNSDDGPYHDLLAALERYGEIIVEVDYG